MRVLRSNPSWVLLVITPLLGGCIIELGAGHDQSAGGDTPSSGGGGGATGLSGAQQARKDEADRYVAQVIYKGATVTQSLQLASGDIVDGLDRSTFPDLPSPLPPLPFLPADMTLPPDVTLAIPDVDQISELADLASTAAVFHRPTFWPYILGETDAKRRCTSDEQCGDGLCDRGRCAAKWSCSNYGKPRSNAPTDVGSDVKCHGSGPA